MDSIGGKVMCSIKGAVTRGIMLCLILCAASSAWADGESLAETGGFVTSTKALAFASNSLTLDDLGSTYYLRARLSGGNVDYKGAETIAFLLTDATDATKKTYQFQSMDGDYTKSVTVEFTVGEDGIYAQAKGAYYGDPNAFGTKLTTGGTLVDNATSKGYALYDLKLVTPLGASDSINVNFTHGTDLSSDSVCIGAGDWIVPYSRWHNLKAVDSVDNTPASKTITVLTENDVTVTLSGTRGSYRCNSLSSSRDLRQGYIDETSTSGKNTPTVTITRIPYSNYRVVVFMATNTENAQFGKVTINGTDYTSNYSSTSMVFGEGYSTIAGSANWGHAGKSEKAQGLAEGINYLVSPVISDSTATIMATRGGNDVRGCIAAVQVVKVDTATIDTAGPYTLTDLFGTVGTTANLYVNVAENATLNIPSDTTIGAIDFNIASGKTLTLSGAKLTATAGGFTVSGGGKVLIDVAGAGAVNYSAKVIDGRIYGASYIDLTSSAGGASLEIDPADGVYLHVEDVTATLALGSNSYLTGTYVTSSKQAAFSGITLQQFYDGGYTLRGRFAGASIDKHGVEATGYNAYVTDDGEGNVSSIRYEMQAKNNELKCVVITLTPNAGGKGIDVVANGAYYAASSNAPGFSFLNDDGIKKAGVSGGTLGTAYNSGSSYSLYGLNIVGKCVKTLTLSGNETLTVGTDIASAYDTLTVTGSGTLTVSGILNVDTLVVKDGATVMLGSHFGARTISVASGAKVVYADGEGSSFDWATISGAGTVEIHSGTVILRQNNSSLTGGITVKTGAKLKPGDWNAFGPQSNDTWLTVESGGTVDMGGTGVPCSFRIAGDGEGNGAIVNTGAAIGNTSAQMRTIELTADASIGGTGNFGMIANSYDSVKLKFPVGGATLTKKGGNSFWLCNVSRDTGGGDGTIVVEEGSLYVRYCAQTLSGISLDFNGGTLTGDAALTVDAIDIESGSPCNGFGQSLTATTVNVIGGSFARNNTTSVTTLNVKDGATATINVYLQPSTVDVASGGTVTFENYNTSSALDYTAKVVTGSGTLKYQGGETAKPVTFADSTISGFTGDIDMRGNGKLVLGASGFVGKGGVSVAGSSSITASGETMPLEITAITSGTTLTVTGGQVALGTNRPAGTIAFADAEGFGTSALSVKFTETERIIILNVSGAITANEVSVFDATGAAAEGVTKTLEAGKLTITQPYTLSGSNTTWATMTSGIALSNCHIDVTESTELDISAAVSGLSRIVFNVDSGKVLTLTGSSISASEIYVVGGGVVSVSANNALAGTIKGDGVLQYVGINAEISGLSGLTDSSAWRGTLCFKNIPDSFKLPIPFNSLGNSLSTVRLDGVEASYISIDGNKTTTIIPTVDIGENGLKVTDSNGGGVAVIETGRLTGSGALAFYNGSISGSGICIKDGDMFPGKIEMRYTNRHQVTFSDIGGVAEITGKIVVSNDFTAVAKDRWFTWSGTDVYGTLKLEGAGRISGPLNTKSGSVLDLTDMTGESVAVSGTLTALSGTIFKLPSALPYQIATGGNRTYSSATYYVEGEEQLATDLMLLDGWLWKSKVINISDTDTLSGGDSGTYCNVNVMGSEVTLSIDEGAAVGVLKLNTVANTTITIENADRLTVGKVIVVGGGKVVLQGALSSDVEVSKASGLVGAVTGDVTFQSDTTMLFESSEVLSVTGTITVSGGNTLTVNGTVNESSSTFLSATEDIIGTVETTMTEEGYTYSILKTGTAIKLVRTPNVAFSYDGMIGATPSGWGISFSDDETFKTSLRVGPNADMKLVYQVTESEHPYSSINDVLGNAFSFAVYADVSLMPSSGKAVIVGIGTSSKAQGYNILVLYREGDKVKLAIWNDGASDTTIVGTAAAVDCPAVGYHLYTAVCDPGTGSLSLYLDDSTAQTGSAGAVTLSRGFQIGSIHGGVAADTGNGYGLKGNPGFVRGEGLAFAAIRGYNAVLAADNVAKLAESLPAVSSLNLDWDITVNKANDAKFTACDATMTQGHTLQVHRGEFVIPEGNTLSVPILRTLNINTGSPTIAATIDGTLEITGASGKNVWSEREGATPGGIVFGEWSGSGTYTISSTGRISAPNAYLQTVKSAGDQAITVNGGVISVKGIWADTGKTNSSITLQNGGTLEVAEIPSDGGAITKNFGKGTFRINANATEERAINFQGDSAENVTVLDPNGHTLTLAAAAVTGSGYIKIASGTTGTVVFNGGSFTGTVIIDANAATVQGTIPGTLKSGVADNCVCSVTVEETTTYYPTFASAISAAGANEITVHNYNGEPLPAHYRVKDGKLVLKPGTIFSVW